MDPLVTEIVLVRKGARQRRADAFEGVSAYVEGLSFAWIFAVGNEILATIDFKGEEVTVFPAHGAGEVSMQVVELRIGAHQDRPPHAGRDVPQFDPKAPKTTYRWHVNFTELRSKAKPPDGLSLAARYGEK